MIPGLLLRRHNLNQSHQISIQRILPTLCTSGKVQPTLPFLWCSSWWDPYNRRNMWLHSVSSPSRDCSSELSLSALRWYVNHVWTLKAAVEVRGSHGVCQWLSKPLICERLVSDSGGVRSAVVCCTCTVFSDCLCISLFLRKHLMVFTYSILMS